MNPRQDEQDISMAMMAEGLDYLAPSGAQSNTAVNEERHVRSELSGQFGEFVGLELSRPEVVEAEEAGGSVAATATETCAGGDAFVQMNVEVGFDVRILGHKLGGAADDVFATGRGRVAGAA